MIARGLVGRQYEAEGSASIGSKRGIAEKDVLEFLRHCGYRAHIYNLEVPYFFS